MDAGEAAACSWNCVAKLCFVCNAWMTHVCCMRPMAAVSWHCSGHRRVRAKCVWARPSKRCLRTRAGVCDMFLAGLQWWRAQGRHRTILRDPLLRFRRGWPFEVMWSDGYVFVRVEWVMTLRSQRQGVKVGSDSLFQQRLETGRGKQRPDMGLAASKRPAIWEQRGSSRRNAMA